MKGSISAICFASMIASSAIAAETSLVTPAPEGAEAYFINLKDGAKVHNPVLVQFGLKGMGVAPAGVDNPKAGHFHLLIDLKDQPDLTQPLPSNEHIKHFGGGQTQTELTLAPGKHSLQLMMGNYAHVPFNPPVASKTITITVK